MQLRLDFSLLFSQFFHIPALLITPKPLRALNARKAISPSSLYSYAS